MKKYDKILLVVSAIACLLCSLIYWLLAGAETIKSPRITPKGESCKIWADSQKEFPNVKKWIAPGWDKKEGWNYDLFSAPEITWVSNARRYQAKEMPLAPEEKFGIKVVSIENPKFRLRIDSCSGTFAPIEGRPGKCMAIVSFANELTNRSASINFGALSTSPVKIEKESSNGREITTITPEVPISIGKENVQLKYFKIIRGKSERNDGTRYTRYAAKVIDNIGGRKIEIALGEKISRNPNRIEVILQAEDSEKQWLYSKTNIPEINVPMEEVAERENPSVPFSIPQRGASFTLDNNTYLIKDVDIKEQTVSLFRESQVGEKKSSKAPKVWEEVLTPLSKK